MRFKKKPYDIFDYIRIPFSVSPLLAFSILIYAIVKAIIPSIKVIVTAGLINEVLSTGKNGTTKTLYLFLVVLLVLIVVEHLSEVIMKLIKFKLQNNIIEDIKPKILQKRAALKYEYIENDESWQLIKRVCDDADSKIISGFYNILDVLGLTLEIGSLLLILMFKVWWLPLVIVAVAVPLFKLAVKSGKLQYDANKNATHYKRRADYLKSVVTSRDSVEERTVFQYSSHINDEWFKQFEAARKINIKARIMAYIRMKAAGLIILFIFVAIVGTLIIPLSLEKLSIGLFVSMVNATFSLVHVLSWSVGSMAQALADKREYIKDFNEFAELDENEGALDEPFCENIKGIDGSIEFCNVSFKYPNSEKYILKNFSVKITPNKHYAIVGVNGAGKTTITKLLTGLYGEYEGDIFISGTNLREYQLKELKAIITVIFQDYAKYSLSIEDNVLLGKPWELDDKTMVDRNRLEASIERSGLAASIENFSEKAKTKLGKIYEDGVDVSEGQWQKLSIARALYKQGGVYILDEPTAALDPIAESKLYALYGDISRGSTTLFITHRLGAAKLADEIIVVDGGIVLEQGTHMMLMNKKGMYYRMYESQRKWYE